MKILLPPLTTTYNAVVVGLVLAVTAPTEKKAKDALGLAESLATQLTAREVAKAKKHAEAILASLREAPSGNSYFERRFLD
jgi:hypothetical protein